MTRRSNADLSGATRAALLDQAREAFAAHGYAAAPLDDLVRAAGLTKGALYHHFGSKQGLFMAVVEALDADIMAKVRQALPARSPSRGAFLQACRIWLEATLDPGVRRILLLDCPAVLGHRATRDLDAATSIQPLMQALGELRAAGELRAVDAEATAHLLNGALYDAALWIGENARPAEALERAMKALELLVSGLAPAPKPRRARPQRR